MEKLSRIAPSEKPPEIPPHPRRCEVCMHWKAPDHPAQDKGLCVAQFPQLVAFPGPAGQMGAIGMFPPVGRNDRCGKWEENFDLTEAAPRNVD